MCNNGFTGQSGIDHLTRLLVELNLVNWVDVFGKNFKICFEIVSHGPWLLHSWLQEAHLHLSLFDVKCKHQPCFVCGAHFHIFAIGLSFEIFILSLDFFVSFLQILALL